MNTLKSTLFLTFTLCLTLTHPAMAQSQSASSTPEITSPEITNNYNTLIQLRKDWASRDPALRGSQLLQQQDAFQQRAFALSTAYETSLRSQPRYIRGWIELAEIHFVFLNRFDTAENYLKEALRLSPYHVQANISQAEFDFFFKKDAEAATKRLQNLLKKQKHQPEVLITLADLQTRSNNSPEAYLRLREQLTAARQQYANHEKLQYIEAFVAAQQATLGKTLNTAQAAEALQLYEALLEKHATPRYALETAQIARQLKQPAKAQSILKTAIVKSPENPSLKRLKGDLLLESGASDLDAGRWSESLEQAMNVYTQLLPTSQNLPYSERVQFYYNLGLLAYGKGRDTFNRSPVASMTYFEQAVGYYQKATHLFDQLSMINAALQKDMGKAIEMQGMVHQRQGQKLKSRASFQKACDLKLESSCKRLQN